MDIATPLVHRILTYLAELHREKFHPTKADLVLYARLPDAKLFGHGIVRAGHLMDFEAEDPVEYLGRVGWATTDGQQVRITPLGLAVERALTRVEGEHGEVLETVLDQDDPLAMARLIERMSSVGPGLFADPFFKLDYLQMVLEYTEIDRVLTSRKGKGSEAVLNGLRAALNDLAGDRSIEVRATDDFHDRYVIADDGTVLFVGVSLTGVGKKFSVIGRVQEAASSVADHYEKLWKEADPVKPVQSGD